MKKQLPSVGTNVRWNKTEGIGVVTKQEDFLGHKTFQVYWVDSDEIIDNYTTNDLSPTKIEIRNPSGQQNKT